MLPETSKHRFRDYANKGWNFYCPHCRVERRIKSRPNPGKFIHFFQIGLISSVITLVLWPWMQFKGLVFFLPVWLVFELIYRVRNRIVLVCPECGFDPFLYLTDVQKARAGVETHMRELYQARGVPFPSDVLTEREKQKAEEQEEARARLQKHLNIEEAGTEAEAPSENKNATGQAQERLDDPSRES